MEKERRISEKATVALYTQLINQGSLEPKLMLKLGRGLIRFMDTFSENEDVNTAERAVQESCLAAVDGFVYIGARSANPATRALAAELAEKLEDTDTYDRSFFDICCFAGVSPFVFRCLTQEQTEDIVIHLNDCDSKELAQEFLAAAALDMRDVPVKNDGGNLFLEYFKDAMWWLGMENEPDGEVPDDAQKIVFWKQFTKEYMFRACLVRAYMPIPPVITLEGGMWFAVPESVREDIRSQAERHGLRPLSEEWGTEISPLPDSE